MVNGINNPALLLQRFNAKWTPEPFSGCWLWTGSTRGDPEYGEVTINFKKHSAHRVSWELHNGEIPDGICVCHKCDTPLCVNPNHLFLGTIADNNRDMYVKSRSRKVGSKGEANGSAKLTTAQVILIRNAAGTHQTIASQFGVTRANVGYIKKGKLWKHV